MSQVRSQKNNADTEYFVSLLTECGVTFSSGTELNVITQEQALVVRDIKNELNENGALEENCIKFINGFKILFEKKKYLIKALQPTMLKKLKNDNAIEVPQESLFRILLKLNELQTELIEFILEEIISITTEETDNTSNFRLLLSQLQYLPYIKNPKEFTTKILDILEMSETANKLEILFSIPDILPDSEYDEIAKYLCKLIDDDNGDLIGAYIDCLNALNLDLDIMNQVQDVVLTKMISGTHNKVFPIFLEFLLTDCDKKVQNLLSIFLKIRIALDNLMVCTDEDIENTKVLVFNKLQLKLYNKNIAECWINIINRIKIHTDHKPIDYLILFMLHSKIKQRKRSIENIFRKHIKDGLFKCEHLKKLFEKYLTPQLLKDYFNSILEIASSLIRTSIESIVFEFSSTLFKSLFNHSKIELIYRQELLDCLILLIRPGDGKKINPILNIFNDLLLDDIEKLRHHTVSLMQLLEMLDNFTLSDAKQVFEILCALTNNCDNYGFKNDIHIVICKQLSTSKKNIKNCGIISAVVMAKYLAMINNEIEQTTINNIDDDDDDSVMSINDIPSILGREAANLLELVNTSCNDIYEFLGLYYDELASMILARKYYDKNFLKWLFDRITVDFQTKYITENICDKINNLEFSIQYNLNEINEINEPIAVNIAGLTLKSKCKENILLLAAHFKLLRLLHYRLRDGDLSSIDALLGCGVILPEIHNFEQLDIEQLKNVSDCIFHCINWFREVISGFVKQKNENLRKKILKRLENLIELENLLKNCLEIIPQHKLPKIDFHSSQIINKQSPIKQTNKKFKSTDIVIDAPSTSNALIKPSQREMIKHKKSIQEYKINFREIDIDIVVLFKYPLNFAESSSKQTLTIQQLKFLLNDFSLKLNKLIKKENLGLSPLNIINTRDLIQDCKLILLNINAHLKAIVKKIENILEQCDNQINSPDFYTEDVKDLKYSFGLILEILHLIFSWSGFQHPKNLDLFRDLLHSLRDPDEPVLYTTNRLALEFVIRLESYINKCLHLNDAVCLIKIMETIQNIIMEVEIKTKIVSTSEKLLKQKWYNDCGKIDFAKGYSANIDILIKAYFECTNVEKLFNLIEKIEEETTRLKRKEDRLETFQSIDKKNFIIFYRNLCQILLDRIKIETQSLTNDEHLVLWMRVATIMKNLMEIAKIIETKNIFVCFLKKSIAILKFFLSDGIPIMEIMLRSKPDDVVDIFKTFQNSTRFLHHLCCYSKLKKDQSLMAYVPKFRFTLETLVFRVKAALVANNCSAAFWMGNLRNRDLQGEDILSQNSTASESKDESEEELADDDDDDDTDDDVFKDKGNEYQSSSEVYD